MNNRNHRNERTEEMGWSSFLSGALVGGGIALLLAPQSGTELRSLICDYAGRTKENLLERAEEAYDGGAGVIKDAAQAAKEFAQQGQETVQDAGRSAKEFAKQTQDADREAKG